MTQFSCTGLSWVGVLMYNNACLRWVLRLCFLEEAALIWGLLPLCQRASILQARVTAPGGAWPGASKTRWRPSEHPPMPLPPGPPATTTLWGPALPLSPDSAGPVC